MGLLALLAIWLFGEVEVAALAARAFAEMRALAAAVSVRELVFAAAAAAATAALTLRFWPQGRRLWHDFANENFVARPRPLLRPWVVDGDTIDDEATGVRYRLANIDAPELDAPCFRARERAEQAKRAAIFLVRRARQVAVRRTFRWDMYGRRVAFVLVDGQDLGEILIKRGLAVRWRGQREKWCGPRGGLARIAAAGLGPHSCKTCGATPIGAAIRTLAAARIRAVTGRDRRADRNRN